MLQDPHSMDHKKEKQAAIFEAACSVIREKGFHQARIVDIARHAGISYGLVYHYFGSKADLFDAISKEWWDGLYAMMDQCESQPASIDDRLAMIVNYFLDLYERRPNLVHVFIAEISRSTANLTPARLEFFTRFFDRTERIMAGAQDLGTLRKDVKPRYLTYIFLGALEGFISTMVMGEQLLKGREQRKRIARGILDVFFYGASASGQD